MKRNYLYILMAMFGMLFASCQKDLEGVLTASIEGYDGGEEKMYINHNNADGLYYACWHDGDWISVNNMKCRIKLQWYNNHALVKGIDLSNLTTIDAVYPATIENKVVWKGEQRYREVAMPNGTKAQVVEAPMVATAVKDEEGNANLVFKNVGGLVKVSQAEGKKVRRIEVTNLNGGMLWGEADYSWTGGVPMMGALSGGSNSVAMDIPSTATVNDFYVAVPQLSGAKLKVTVVYEETSGFKVWTKTTNNAGGVTVGRNQLLSVPVNFAATSNIPYTLSGSGSETNPYLINSLLDWNAFVKGCKTSDATENLSTGKYFKQMVDIEIVDHVGHFLGTYDGGNHTIVNGTATQKARKGVFDIISDNVTIKNLKVETQMDVSSSWVGGLVNSAEGNGSVKISNCSVSGRIMCSSTYSYRGVGGFIGLNTHKKVQMDNCVNYADINSSKLLQVGGILGCVGDEGGSILTTNTILNRCINYGLIEGSNYVGGLVGFACKEKLKIYNCVNHGKVSVVVVNNISNRGGMVGYLRDIELFELRNSYSSIASSHALIGKAFNNSSIISTTLIFDNVYIYSDEDRGRDIIFQSKPGSNITVTYNHVYIPIEDDLKTGMYYYDASDWKVSETTTALLNSLNNNRLSETLPAGVEKESWEGPNGETSGNLQPKLNFE